MTGSDDVVHRLNVEGTDLLALSGVNDANLHELARLAGVRVSLRGDQLTLSGGLAAVERAASLAQTMVDLARMGEPLGPEDVRRIVEEGEGQRESARNGDLRIVLPGLRRIVTPKTGGQRAYVQAMLDHDIVVSIGPAGTGKTYGSSGSSWPGRRSRRASVWGSCRATCRPRWTRTCGRYTTRSRT